MTFDLARPAQWPDHLSPFRVFLWWECGRVLLWWEWERVSKLYNCLEIENAWLFSVRIDKPLETHILSLLANSFCTKVCTSHIIYET